MNIDIYHVQLAVDEDADHPSWRFYFYIGGWQVYNCHAAAASFAEARSCAWKHFTERFNEEVIAAKDATQ